jgi:hypothetical protein
VPELCGVQVEPPFAVVTITPLSPTATQLVELVQ